MAKLQIYDAYINETGPGMYNTKYFDPTQGKDGDWVTEQSVNGFAEAKMSLILRRKNGGARFGKVIVTRKTKGNY